MKVYAARDKNTGKFVSDLTSRHKKFWDRKNACMNAINEYNSSRYRFCNYDLELVELVCVESEEFDRLKEIEWMYNDLNKQKKGFMVILLCGKILNIAY